jgi:rare lipoprotein A (peptidoglycan hydrolase)
MAVLLAATSMVRAAPARRAGTHFFRRWQSSRARHAPRILNRHAFLSTRNLMIGSASWYGSGFSGRRTASGERFNRNAMTLAHRGLPFGTRVRITNLKNGRVAVARVNDRGPFVRGRIADLSQGLARHLGIGGVGHIKMEVIRPNPPAAAATPPAAAAETPGEQP